MTFLELFWQPLHFSFICPANLVTNVAKATTDTELIGIKMAATTGDKLPLMAKLIPMML